MKLAFFVQKVLVCTHKLAFYEHYFAQMRIFGAQLAFCGRKLTFFYFYFCA